MSGVTFNTRRTYTTAGVEVESLTTCSRCSQYLAADPELLAGHAVSHSADRSDQVAWWQEQERLASVDENLAGVRAAKAALPQGRASELANQIGGE